MPLPLTPELLEKLQKLGANWTVRAGTQVPDRVKLEPPCNLRAVSVSHSLEFGAFSQAVSGAFVGCRIGRYCSFGEQVQIGRHPNPTHLFSTSPIFYQAYNTVMGRAMPKNIDLQPLRDFPRKTSPVAVKITTIGNDVSVGIGAYIAPGVTIGDGAIVEPMAVVTQDVAPYSVVGGSPAQVLRMRFEEKRVDRFLQIKWWEFAPWDLAGTPLEEISSLFGRVIAMREKQVPVYAPPIIDLAELANGSAPEA